MIQTMKTLLLLSILASKIKTIVSATCCELDHTKPNVSNIYPVNGITVNANDWVTFKAEINDNCGVSSVNISIQGYALDKHETRDTVSCPPGYFCRDYRFLTVGENWWTVEATDSCGLQRITGQTHFCVGSCPRYLRSLKDSLYQTDSENLGS